MATESDVKQGQLNPTAMTAEDLARLLTGASGTQVDADDIHNDIDAGAPTNADGTINVVHYAAWLVKCLASRGGNSHRGD